MWAILLYSLPFVIIVMADGCRNGVLGGGVDCWLCFDVWVEGISWSVA